MKLVLSFLVTVLVGAQALSVPSYITTCKRDSNFNVCATESARKAFLRLSEGDSKYHVPQFNPAKVPELYIESPNLKLKFFDVTVDGILNGEVKSIEFDFSRKSAKGIFFIPDLKINSKYNIDGRIIILPITGQGSSEVHFYDGTYTYSFDWDERVKDGKTYMMLKNTKMDYQLKGASLKFQNLFDGDPRLGAEMDKFLNENWQDVLKDIGRPIEEGLKTVVSEVVKGYCESVPMEELFYL